MYVAERVNEHHSSVQTARGGVVHILDDDPNVAAKSLRGNGRTLSRIPLSPAGSSRSAPGVNAVDPAELLQTETSCFCSETKWCP